MVTYAARPLDALRPHAAACVLCTSYINTERSEKMEVSPNGLLMFTYSLLFIPNTKHAHFFLGLFYYFSVGLVTELFMSK